MKSYFLQLGVLFGVLASSQAFKFADPIVAWEPNTTVVFKTKFPEPLPGITTTYETEFQRAIVNWNPYMGGVTFTSEKDSRKKTDPVLSNGVSETAFTDKINGMNWNSSTIGLCIYTYQSSSSSKQKLLEADIFFQNQKNEFHTTLGQTQSSELFYSVALHESGHAGGLDHPDEVGQTVLAAMNSVVSQKTLQADDITGMQLLYGVITNSDRENPSKILRIRRLDNLIQIIGQTSPASKITLRYRKGRRNAKIRGNGRWQVKIPYEKGKFGVSILTKIPGIQINSQRITRSEIKKETNY